MRVTRVPNMRSLNDERGVSVLIVAILLVVFIGFLGMTLDGGLMHVRYRQVRAGNDAAALAAAISCATGKGQSDAVTQAGTLAGDNAAGAVTYGPGLQFPSGCNPSGGTVTVHYQVTQTRYVAPLVGASATGIARANATAKWGPASGATNIAPIIVTSQSALKCEQKAPSPTTHCFLWYDPDDLGNSDWGLMSLDSWGHITGKFDTNCNSYQASQSAVTTWIKNGYPGGLSLSNPPPTWVCASSGSQGGAFIGDITSMIGKYLLFPVEDTPQRVCRSGSTWVPCTGANPIDKYAVIGLSIFKVANAAKGQQAKTMCGKSGNGGGSTACIDIIWTGSEVEGVTPGTGQNFGVAAVALTG